MPYNLKNLLVCSAGELIACRCGVISQAAIFSTSCGDCGAMSSSIKIRGHNLTTGLLICFPSCIFIVATRVMLLIPGCTTIIQTMRPACQRRRGGLSSRKRTKSSILIILLSFFLHCGRGCSDMKYPEHHLLQNPCIMPCINFHCLSLFISLSG